MYTFLNKVFGWPVLSVKITFQGKSVAIVNFAMTTRGWYAMPHSDSLGAWFDESFIHSNAVNASMTIEIFNTILSDEKLFEGIQKGIHSKTIEFYNPGKDFQPADRINDKKLQLSIRSTLPLLDYRSEHKVISVLSLDGGYNGVISRLSSNIRRKIGRAARYGITVKHGGAELTDDFYRVYRKTIHKHGSFGAPKAVFRNMPPDKTSLFVAYLNNKPVGAAKLSMLMGTAENTAFATLTCYNRMYTSYALHNAMLYHAVANNCTMYSFGRSTPGSNVHKYKQQWGTVDKVLYYNSTHPVKASGHYDLIRKVIRTLPMWMSAAFDRFVAERIF